MKLKSRDLYDLEGQIDRTTYLIWGVLLFAIKFNIDRFAFRAMDVSEWEAVNYFRWNFPTPDVLSALKDPEHGLVLFAVSIPFLSAGVVLTMQRLKAAHMPKHLAVLFVIPVLKWFLFLLALLAPSKPDSLPSARDEEPNLFRFLPHTRLGSALAAVVITALLTTLAIYLGAHLLANYGWGLFVGVPFLAGFIASVLHGTHVARSVRECVGVACLSVTVAGVMVMAVAVEGIICLLMAAPLAYPLAILGGVVGYTLQPRRAATKSLHLHGTFLLSLPLMVGSETLGPSEPPKFEVTTSIEVKATPEQVWHHVVSFAELPPPTEWIFRAGVAHPLRAEIRGEGVGAVRHCIFSTGPFVEPIEVWDEPNLLRFSVTTSPAPMQEWTPYKEIHPPHLEGFLESEQGQFRLAPLPNGWTRLEGTTWYRHGLWPSRYWKAWSDFIIHTIHRRVLKHIKTLTETGVP